MLKKFYLYAFDKKVSFYGNQTDDMFIMCIWLICVWKLPNLNKNNVYPLEFVVDVTIALNELTCSFMTGYRTVHWLVSGMINRY